jgi:autotransporter-associated beta strand protein
MIILATLRRYRSFMGWFMICLMMTSQMGPSLQAATLYWDSDASATDNNALTGANLGGTGDWNSSALNWWNPLATLQAWDNSAFDMAVFTGAAGTVTLKAPMVAGGLTFNRNGYLLISDVPASNTLTLTPPTGSASPVITVNNNGLGTNRATISALLAGSSGFTKAGNGALVLSGNNASLSGDIAIKGGTVVITNANQLGSTTGTAISVTGVANTTGAAGGAGFTGGALVLQGSSVSAGSTAGITLNRELSLAGRGPGANNSTGALVSIGYNTLAGGLTIASPATEARAWASHGTTTVSGPVFFGTGAAQTLSGNGNWNITGQVTGVDTAGDRLIKGSALVGTTMWLQNANNNFAQPTRIDGGTVRVAVNGALGINTSTGQVDLNNGTIEVRTDAASGFAGRTVRYRNNTTGTIFVDHDLSGPLSLGSGSLQNQTVTFGGLIRDAGVNTVNFNYAGRNGYSLSFTSALPAVGDHRQWTINNNTNGTLTYTGNTWNTNASSANTYTVQGGAETIITGSVIASGALHALTKASSGTLSLQGTASTYTGLTSINDGTIAISSVGALNASATNRVAFGGGALSFLGAAGTGAGETWTNKTLDVAAANAYVLANQSGSAPTGLVLPNTWASSTAAARTLNLGGNAPGSVINQVTGLITNSVNLSNLLKFDTGTWELQAPSAASLAGSATTLNLAATGTTATSTVTLTSGNTTGLTVGQPIAGSGIPAGTTISQIVNATTLVLSANRTASTVAATATTTVVSGAVATVTNTIASGTGANPVLTLASTAGLVPGQRVTSSGLPASQVWFIRDITSLTTVTLASATGATLAAGIPVSEVVTPQSFTNFAGSLTIANGTLRIANGGVGTTDVLSATTNLIFNTDPVTLRGNAGGTFNYVGLDSGSSTESLGRLVPTAGHGVVSITSGTGADTLTFLDIGARGAGATLNYQPGIGTINFSGTAPAGSNGIQSGYATFNGVDWVTSGATASQFTAYTAGAGALTLAATTNFSIAGAASTAAAGSMNSLKLTGGAALTLGGQLSFTTNPGGVLFDNSGGTASITGSILGTTAQELVVTTNGSSPAVAPASGAALTTGNALTIGSTISSGAGSLTKSGNGTLILTGANVYTGNTVINQGAIQMSGATAALGGLGTAGNQTAIRQGAILDVNGAGALAALVSGSLTTYPQISIGALTGTGLITNSNAAQSTVSLGGTATTGTTTFGGTLQDGAGILNVVINGTSARSQAILGAQTYTGVTVINTGNLAVTRLADGGTASGLGASSNAASNLIFNGGTLTYVGAAAAGATSGGGIYQTTQTPSTSTNRLFTLAGNATIQSSGTYGNEAAAAGTGANNASLIWSNTGDLQFVNAGARTLTLGGTSTGDNEMRIRLRNNPNLNEALALTKADAGLWILNPLTSNDYTGTTTISGGALRAITTGSVLGIPTNSNITLSGGVLEVAGTSFTRTLGTGAGQVQLTAGSTGFAAGTTDRLVVNLSSGAALTWGTGSFNPATALVLGSSTALGETEITNNINLGTAGRTVTVNANGNTGTMVTAGILSGVISGGAGGNLTKNGGGVLMLGNANTYVGNTTITDGSFILTSIGAAGATSSALGTNVSGGSLIFNRNETLNAFIYVGEGETATRPIVFQSAISADRTHRMDASGSGALVLSNITNSNTGAFTMTLDLRGSNTDNNMITSVLANNGTSLLGVSKNDGGTWILNPAGPNPNTFTGVITAGGGNLGLTANGIGAASQINLNNGAIFAFGGALTTNKLIQLNNNTAALFGGQNAITINANVQKQAGGNDQTISNNLEGGALLTINGNYVNLENPTTVATRTLNVRGYGSTVWNGVIADSSNIAATGTTTGAPTFAATAGSRSALNIAIDPNASFTLTGGSANTYTGGTTLTDGILIVDKVGAFGAVSASTMYGGTSVFAFNGGTLRVGSSLANLTGANAITNAVQLNNSPAKVDGSKSIEFSGGVALGASRTFQNELTGGAQLIISGTGITNSAASTLTLFGAGNTLISGAYNAGTGANGLTYSGNNTLTLNAANTATGLLTVNRGTVSLGGANGAWNSTGNTFTLNANGILQLDNSVTNNNNRLLDGGAITIARRHALADRQQHDRDRRSPNRQRHHGHDQHDRHGQQHPDLRDSELRQLRLLPGPTHQWFGLTNKVLGTIHGGSDLLAIPFSTACMINGDFATYDVTNGVVAFTAYNAHQHINTAAATDTMSVTATSAGLTVSRTLNALKIER